MDININLLFFSYTINSNLVSNMGSALKSQSIEIQNQKRSPFNNMDLVWTKNVWHEGSHIIEVQSAYISHAWISEFFNNEWSHEDSSIEWNIYKQTPPQPNVKMQKVQHHIGHIWYDVLLVPLVMQLSF